MICLMWAVFGAGFFLVGSIIVYYASGTFAVSGIAALAVDGFDRVIVAHGDLPRATDLARCADFDGVTLVPDRHGDGTPVAVVPVDVGFRFAYGPGSHARHVAEAQRLGLAWRSLPDPDLGWDVDEPADLEFQTST